jgi:hypothetical protein
MLQVSVVSATWILLYLANDWLFDRFAVSNYASWIFLPAALRMLAVMLAGWKGVLGLFIGSFITGIYSLGTADPGAVLVMAGVSALAPMVAYLLCVYLLGLRSDLKGLSATQLICVSIASALLTAGLHNVHFAATGTIASVANNFVTMFVGDLIGTFVVLYAAKLLMSFVPSRPESL